MAQSESRDEGGGRMTDALRTTASASGVVFITLIGVWAVLVLLEDAAGVDWPGWLKTLVFFVWCFTGLSWAVGSLLNRLKQR